MALADEPDQERTEQPTGRRREEARARGQVARSGDLGGAVVLLGALGMFALAGPRLMADTVAAFRGLLESGPRGDLGPARALEYLAASAVAGARLFAPVVLVPALASVLAQLLQTRFAVNTRALQVDWSRISPVQGVRRLFRLRSVAELLKALLKLGAIGAVGWFTLHADWWPLMTLGQAGVEALPAALGRAVGDVWLAVAIAYLVLAGADYGYQWWEHERGLRMTRQEVREETRQSEGDPQLRARQKSLHRQMTSRRMLAEVKRADVVVRNPTHYAVALRYDGGRAGAPRVVAKGARLMALRIIELARRHGVPVVENPPLARALHAAVKVGAEIPPALYRAVAEVLAHVYALRGPGR